MKQERAEATVTQRKKEKQKHVHHTVHTHSGLQGAEKFPFSGGEQLKNCWGWKGNARVATYKLTIMISHIRGETSAIM